VRGERWLRQGKGLSFAWICPRRTADRHEGTNATTTQSLVSRLARRSRQSQRALLSNSPPGRIRSAHLLSPLLVAWLLLSPLIAHDALIGSMAAPRLTPSWRLGLRLRHALLAAMLAALILHTFQIVFLRHRTLFSQRFPDQQA